METTLNTIDTYLAALNETDPVRRAQLVEESWNADGTYVDPMLEAVGHAAFGEMVGTIHAAYPGATFVRTTEIDGHHDLLRFGWALVGADGAVIVEGIDVGELDADGKLRGIAGFFGPLVDR